MTPPNRVQIFGTRKSPATRTALRFFAERRIPTHFVDLDDRGIAPGELRRFVERFGIDALLDRTSRRFAELGLGAARFSPERWTEKLCEEPLLLRQPLVRCERQLTVGVDEAAWRAWAGR